MRHATQSLFFLLTELRHEHTALSLLKPIYHWTIMMFMGKLKKHDDTKKGKKEENGKRKKKIDNRSLIDHK